MIQEKEFMTLVERNQGIIYKLVSLYCTDKEEKKDLYQEILLQAWKSYGKFRNDSKFSTWLYSISLNTILTQKRKRSIIDYKESLEPLMDTVYTQTLDEYPAVTVYQALRKLPETDRALMCLHLDGYENAEIATVIGISTNHVAVRLHRIKKQLSTVLKNEFK